MSPARMLIETINIGMPRLKVLLICKFYLLSVPKAIRIDKLAIFNCTKNQIDNKSYDIANERI